MKCSTLLSCVGFSWLAAASAFAAPSTCRVEDDKSCDYEAGPIYRNEDAATICPQVCAKNNLEWNGQWTTTLPGRMSVCGCRLPADPTPPDDSGDANG